MEAAAQPQHRRLQGVLTELYTHSTKYGLKGPQTPPAAKDWKRTRKYSESGVTFRDFTHKGGYEATLAEREGTIALEKATGLTVILTPPESSSLEF